MFAVVCRLVLHCVVHMPAPYGMMLASYGMHCLILFLDVLLFLVATFPPCPFTLVLCTHARRTVIMHTLTGACMWGVCSLACSRSQHAVTFMQFISVIIIIVLACCFAGIITTNANAQTTVLVYGTWHQ